MKKIIFIFLSVLLLSGIVASYAFLANNNLDIPAKQKQAKNSKEQAKRALDQSYIKPKKQNIIFTSNSDAVLKRLYPTIDEFNKDNDVNAIIKGKISNIEYSYQYGFAQSILTVDVLKTFKGDVPITIKAYEDGGFIKLMDVIERDKDRFKDATYTSEQLENGVVDFKFENAPHAEVGQQVILYLIKNKEPLPTDTFLIASSVYGRFTLNKNSRNYERNRENIDPSNFEASIPEAVMEKKLIDIK